MKEIINKIKNKKKKKGFTLVELLAVIVILAIIMILTIPTVLNNVGEAKKKSFETVGKTLMKYIDDNYQNCKLGNKDIAKYDESLFDPNTCNLKNDIKEGSSKDWISNAGYNKEDISEVKVSINSEGKVDIMVKPSEDGEFKESEDFTTIVLNYDPSCWNYSGSIVEGFNGLDAEGNILEKCNGFIEKDSEGLYHLEIPSNINGTQISIVGGWDMDNNFQSIKKYYVVTIPQSITVIQGHAFAGSGLKKIMFEGKSNLEEIGYNSFGQTKLEEITIPASVTLINMSAFENTSTLTKVNFEKNSQLEKINAAAFSGTSIENITIPASVVTIDISAFYGSSLKNVDFEENSQLTTIGDKAFNGTSLSSITIPKTVTVIGINAFTNNEYLTTINYCGPYKGTGWYKNPPTEVSCS